MLVGSPKRTLAAFAIRLGSDLHMGSEEQMHSAAIAVISLSTFFS